VISYQWQASGDLADQSGLLVLLKDDGIAETTYRLESFADCQRLVKTIEHIADLAADRRQKLIVSKLSSVLE